MIQNIVGKIAKDIVSKGIYKKFNKKQNLRAILILQALADAKNMNDMKRLCEPPSLKLHKLKGELKDFWSITIEKPYCIIFQYKKGIFINVEIGDYHD